MLIGGSVYEHCSKLSECVLVSSAQIQLQTWSQPASGETASREPQSHETENGEYGTLRGGGGGEDAVYGTDGLALTKHIGEHFSLEVAVMDTLEGCRVM